MCGIVGYIGNKNIKNILLNGLQELEYRGYDSSGIAIIDENGIYNSKAIGKLKNLIEKTKNYNSKNFNIGIGHTRWATHGKPTELNAHPHFANSSYLVHNGIIENYKEIKEKLEKNNITFISQTDTEIIVKLFQFNLEKNSNYFLAFEKTLEELEGAYSILLIDENRKDEILFAKNGSPLILGIGENENFFASSDTPLIGFVEDIIYLQDGDYGLINKDNFKILNDKNIVTPKIDKLSSNKLSSQKDGFRFFMEKEIYEQHKIINDTIMGRLRDDKICFDKLNKDLFDGINEIKICACGTSYHSGLSGSYLFERISKIKCSIEIASEFRYKQPLLTKNTLFIIISQSGETADTLEVLKMAKKAGLKTLVICNVDNSSMVRFADSVILTRAGVEKGVASTKAFATQMVVLWMLSLYIAKLKNTQTDKFIADEIKIIKQISNVVKVKDKLHEKVRRLSKRYLHGHGFFFIGRDIFYPLALEGALKLKEISYLHAEGYPAGEMKHGPIALADSELFTIALMPKNILYDKIKSNVEELSARDTTILAISPLEFDIADDFIKTTECNHYMLEYFEMMMILQLFAMEISIRLGNDVDMPRNLAKSVTVE